MFDQIHCSAKVLQTWLCWNFHQDRELSRSNFLVPEGYTQTFCRRGMLYKLCTLSSKWNILYMCDDSASLQEHASMSHSVESHPVVAQTDDLAGDVESL